MPKSIMCAIWPTAGSSIRYFVATLRKVLPASSWGPSSAPGMAKGMASSGRRSSSPQGTKTKVGVSIHEALDEPGDGPRGRSADADASPISFRSPRFDSAALFKRRRPTAPFAHRQDPADTVDHADTLLHKILERHFEADRGAFRQGAHEVDQRQRALARYPPLPQRFVPALVGGRRSAGRRKAAPGRSGGDRRSASRPACRRSATC